jgi:hypothetical protein
LVRGARRTSLRAKFAKWVDEQPSFHRVDVDFNDAVAGPEPIVATIDPFLDGGLVVDAKASTVDPSLYRNRAG